MINDLLDLTRIEQGRVELEIENVNCRRACAGGVRAFRRPCRRLGRAALLPGRRPSAGRDGRSERIEHVFDNLISNALQHTDRGGRITLGAKPRRSASSSRSRTPVTASPPNTWAGSSTSSSASRVRSDPAARAWAWRSFARSSPRMADRSTSAARLAREPFSPSRYPQRQPAPGGRYRDHTGVPRSKHSGNSMSTRKNAS